MFIDCPLQKWLHESASVLWYIHGVSRLVDVTAGGDFLGPYDQEILHINMCPILDGYGFTGIF